MITIKVLNSRELIEEEKGVFIGSILPYFLDVERCVETMLVEQLSSEFSKNNVKAEIKIVSGPHA